MYNKTGSGCLYNPFLPKSLQFLLTQKRDFYICFSRIQGPALISWLRDQRNLLHLRNSLGNRVMQDKKCKKEVGL